MFGITSYLHKFGVTEDGEDYIGEMLFVTAERADGTRYAHDATYPTVRAGYGESGPHFEDRRDDARSRVEKLVERIKAAHGDVLSPETTLNPDFWTEVAPVYGSKAYVDMDMEGVYAELERREG